MKLKVCGLTKEDHVRYCIRNKVEFCGFILNYPKSHRFVSFDKAKKDYKRFFLEDYPERHNFYKYINTMFK